MHPSKSHGSNVKSGIPQPVSKGNKTQINSEQQETENSARGPGQPQTSCNHPLAAVTNKKKTKKKNQLLAESWADETVESQSQKSRSQSKSDSMRRKEDMERQLREAEDQIGELSEIIEKREKFLEETKIAADSKIEELEGRLMDQEGIMADHGIDPVTGQKVPLSEGDKKQKTESKKITKKTVQAMREKLREMNQQTETFLADIENTMQYLASLEDASDRVGPFSEETQAMIDRISGDEEAIRKVCEENKQLEKKTDGAKSNDSEDEGLDEEENGESEPFFITNAANGENIENKSEENHEIPEEKFEDVN